MSSATAKVMERTMQDEKLRNELLKRAESYGVDLDSREFSLRMDQDDPLAEFRTRFTFPTMKSLPCTDESLVKDDEECIYLCGNSLGLKPKTADLYMKDVLDCWGNMGVFAHFNGRFPAAYCDLLVKDSLAKLAGASPEEVVCMNGLSVNIHLLLISFYQPTETRYKIMIEDHAFPSDRYAAISQLNIHGHTEEDGLVILKPRPGKETLDHEDIIAAIKEHGPSVAVIFLSGVHYYTGQKFDIEPITRAGREQGCIVGWDLAHAVGNVQLKLHDWNVDFACWCSYKYLNSGAGGIAGAFVHQRHHEETRPKLNGWWSNRTETRFEMRHTIDTANGADAYRLCNPPPWLVALHKAGLEIFEEAGIERLAAKRYLLTGYLEHLMDVINDTSGVENLINIITPRDPQQRGTQLSIIFSIPLKNVHEQLEKRGVVCDIRLPSVMRLAPVPTYTSFADVYRFYTILKQVIHEEFNDTN